MRRLLLYVRQNAPYMHGACNMHAKMTHYVHLENMHICARQCQFLRTNSK